MLEDVLTDAAEKWLQEIKDRMIAANQVATGKTINSLELKYPSATSLELWGARYISVLEDGRPPRKGNNEDPDFLDNLKEWIVAKGLNYGDAAGLDRLAKFLKFRINQLGTKLYRSGGGNDIFKTPTEDFFEHLEKELKKQFSVEITNNLRG